MIGTDYRAKISAGRWRFQGGGTLKVSTRGLIEAYGKIKFSQSSQSLREMVNGVVLHRPRTVAAVTLHFQTKVDVIFFAGLHAQQHALALFGLEITGVG